MPAPLAGGDRDVIGPLPWWFVCDVARRVRTAVGLLSAAKGGAPPTRDARGGRRRPQHAPPGLGSCSAILVRTVEGEGRSRAARGLLHSLTHSLTQTAPARPRRTMTRARARRREGARPAGLLFPIPLRRSLRRTWLYFGQWRRFSPKVRRDAVIREPVSRCMSERWSALRTLRGACVRARASATAAWARQDRVRNVARGEGMKRGKKGNGRGRGMGGRPARRGACGLFRPSSAAAGGAKAGCCAGKKPEKRGARSDAEAEEADPG